MGTTFTWTGSDGAAWQDSGNWDVGSGYPGETVNDDIVVIDGPRGAPANPAGARTIAELQVTATDPSGQLGTVYGRINAWTNVTITAAVSIGGGGTSGYVLYGPTITGDVTFPGTDLAILGTSAGDVTAGGALILRPIAGNMELTSSTITVGGNLVTEPSGVAGVNRTIQFASGTHIIGPGTADALYVELRDAEGSPGSITGFGPAYKEGSAGSTLVGTYLGTITVPPRANVENGTTYGNGDVTGTLSPQRLRTRTRW